MPLRGRELVPLAVALVLVVACGGRSAVSLPLARDGGVARPHVERCDGLDNDLDQKVDETFRDAQGNYVSDTDCGQCGHACDAPVPHAEQVGCALREGAPACVAQSCAAGFGPSHSGGCVALDDRLCLNCRDDGDCGTLASARCAQIDNQGRCTRGCEVGCPQGYVCFGGDYCEPISGSCGCETGGEDFALACIVQANAGACAGSAHCSAGVLSTCRAPEESCDGLDDDCDGRTDEGFVDVRGIYSLDAKNCGACGFDCTADDDAGVAFTCGGDPFAPSCVTLCPDALDGIEAGDFLDADRTPGNGCECKVSALIDQSGVADGDTTVDSNCDGADGEVLDSYYVAVGGDDAGPGSSTRPLRSITEGIKRAALSVLSASPRPQVYVASGVYTETLHMREGVQLHGGYRSDFLSLNPSGFPVIVIAPADTDAPGGAALVAQDVGRLPSLIEGFSFRGRDAAGLGEPAIGVALLNVGARLSLRACSVRSGIPGPGASGAAGGAGSGPATGSSAGAPQRAAIEDAEHACLENASNVVRGGSGGRQLCGGLDVSGGDGASPACPRLGGVEPRGADGHGDVDAPGGGGGNGGDDMVGPLLKGTSCASDVCCGLSDFSVPTNFKMPQPGKQGADGAAGMAGMACQDPVGRFDATAFVAGLAGSGSDGRSGGGGGGGGGGSGAQIAFVDTSCEFADGLGGGGGGGGAAGCAGTGGAAGQSGGPAIGILLVPTDPATPPTITDVDVLTQDGGRGGNGGAGGDGGPGGSGGLGGRLTDAQRSTPTLAGPGQGERGGKGGDGGSGGGGGGGCGGASVGLWMMGENVDPGWAETFGAANRFVLGEGGKAGSGGGGAVPAAAGFTGNAIEVHIQ